MSTTTTFHLSAFGDFRGFRADLDGYVYLTPESARAGRWDGLDVGDESDLEYLVDLVSDNVAALPRAEAALAEWRSQ